MDIRLRMEDGSDVRYKLDPLTDRFYSLDDCIYLEHRIDGEDPLYMSMYYVDSESLLIKLGTQEEVNMLNDDIGYLSGEVAPVNIYYDDVDVDARMRDIIEFVMAYGERL